MAPSRTKRKPSVETALKSSPVADAAPVDTTAPPASPPTDGPLHQGPQDQAFASSDASPDVLELIAPPTPPAGWPEVPPAPNPGREHQRSARARLLDLLVTPLTIGVVALLLPVSWLSRRSRSERVVPRAGR